MDPDEITPPQFKKSKADNFRDAAANIARAKLDSLYSHEPNAEQEAKEVEELGNQHLSKHQRFMKQLTDSGMNTVQIQTAWHDYYNKLDETEKHQVWQEFYSEQALLKKQKLEQERAEAERQQHPQAAHHAQAHPQSHSAHQQHHTQSHHAQTSRYQQPMQHHTAASAIHIKRMRRKHHIKSLAFGLGMGGFVVFVLLFSFFNEKFITPFIRPSANVSATPIIVDPNSTGPVGPESKIIIPKINVEVPVIYDVPTLDEKDIQSGLERGVVHYPTTANPGEVGNAVIFGHSSSNILNKGKYKFAFILLKSLDEEDTFIVQKDGKRYVYKVYNKYVTTPTDFSVLEPKDKASIMTLITCDPPGTSTNRLIVQAEQIFPDPSKNTVSSAASGAGIAQTQQLPSNSVSLWQRIKNWF